MSTALQNNNRFSNRGDRYRGNRTHHSTGRTGFSSSSNYRRESSEPEQPQTNSSPVRGIYNDPRTVMMLCSFMGSGTTVKTRNGNKYKGYTISFSDKGDIAMANVRLDNDDSTHNPIIPGIIIPKDRFVVCKTNGVDLKSLCSSTDFTDSGIASRLNGSSDSSMKELQPWQDDDVPEPSSFLSDDPSDGWDSSSMFQANKDKFNLQTTYSEDLHEYTTRLPDPSSEGYEEKEKFAQRQAEEIEKNEAYQSRISKELTDGDEESLFSSVHRGETNSQVPRHMDRVSEVGSHMSRHQDRVSETSAHFSRHLDRLGENSAQIPGHLDRAIETSNVHQSRHQDGNLPIGKNMYANSNLREENEQFGRGDSHRMQGRGHSTGHHQPSPHSHHPNIQQSPQQMNNANPGQSPSTGPLSRGQGLSQLHPRQHGQHNHAAHPLSHPHHQQQQPPSPSVSSHPGIQPSQQHTSPVSSQQHPQQRPSTHQQVAAAPLPPEHPPSKSQHPPRLQQHPPNVGISSPSPQNHPPPPLSQTQQPPPPHKAGPHHKQSGPHQAGPHGMKNPNLSGPPGPSLSAHDRQQAAKNNNEVVSGVPKPQQDLFQQKPAVKHSPPSNMPTTAKASEAQHLVSSSSSSSLAEAQQTGPVLPEPAVTSVPALVADRKVGRSNETSTEERNKIGQSLHDFQKNFVLDSGAAVQDITRLEDVSDMSVTSTPGSSSVVTTSLSSMAEGALQLGDSIVDDSSKADMQEDSLRAPKSSLNPNAKEFKPKSQPAVPMEPQSPSPQPGSSPLITQMVHHYPTQPAVYLILPNPLGNQQRKRATVSLSTAAMNDIAAHQVSGQPLIATQPPGNIMLVPAVGGQMPAAYQLYSPQMINHRMMAPGSLTMGPGGQITGLEQAAAQNQPQPVFVTAQQQPMHAPIPAHLHPQPPHAQVISLPSSNQQAQTPHMPNPVPSPVQHQQPGSQNMPQQLQHHISQGPPQSSATPQPPHYPQISVNYTHNIQAVPRTSMSGQQTYSAGPSPVNFISAPQFAYNGNTGQYSFPPGPQPQTSQNSSHGSGPQPQYVIMPQPNTQGHPPMQHHAAQPYTATSIPFQPQHLMQGPPHLPPNHAANANQNSQHMIHPGLAAGLHQQVSNTQPNVYMQASLMTSMPSQCYIPKEGTRSTIYTPAVPTPTIMFTWP